MLWRGVGWVIIEAPLKRHGGNVTAVSDLSGKTFQGYLHHLH